MARNKRASRKRSTFKKQNGSNVFAGFWNNRCMCQDCRGSRSLY